MNPLALPDGTRFETIDSLEEVRAVLGEPRTNAVRKDIARIDENFAQFLALSPFALLGTAGADGACDVSPRGDQPGFVRILDETHIALPERPGNRRLDSFKNILETGRAGLLFLIPGKGETVRINGRAAITRDATLLATMAVDGRLPQFAIVITVEEAYLHCPKALMRSRLWEPDSRADLTQLPSPGAMYRQQLDLDNITAEEIDHALDKENCETLW